MAYGGSQKDKSSRPKSMPAPRPSSKSSPMTERQKTMLKNHMDKHKDLKDLSPAQMKSHRAKMMSRMKKGMSIAKAHKDIMD
tara:strand:+ start:90 stop:335 length:246 start_codon:yes stop_codon:yes gene_type:complete